MSSEGSVEPVADTEIAADVEAEADAEEVAVVEKPTERVDITGALVGDLGNAEIEKDWIIKILTKSVKWVRIVLDVSSSVGWSVDGRKKETLLNSLLELIDKREDMSQLDDEKVTDLILRISGFRNIVKLDTVYKMGTVLAKLFPLLSGEAKQNAVTELDDGKYAPLAHVVLALSGEFAVEKIVENLSYKNHAVVQALIYLYTQTTFAAVPEDQRKLLVEAQTGLVKGLLSSDPDAKILALKLLDANMNFKVNDEDPENMIPFDMLVDLLRGKPGPVEIETMTFLGKLALQSENVTAEARLMAVLAKGCDHLETAEGPYAQALIKFLEMRKGLPSLVFFMTSMFMSVESSFAGLVICLEMGLFQEHPELIEAAFPHSVKAERLPFSMRAVQYMSEQEKFTKELEDATFSHLLLIYESKELLDNSKIKKAAVASVEHFVQGCARLTAVVAETLVREIVMIKDHDILVAFADALSHIEIDPLKNVSEEEFCEMFCFVFAEFESYGHVFHLASLFTQVKDKAMPTTAVELVDRLVPTEFLGKLLTTAEGKLNNAPRLSVLCAAIPNHMDQKLDGLAEFLTAFFTRKLGVEFLFTASIRYFTWTLDYLERSAFGQHATRNILINRATRLRSCRVVKAAFQALPMILDGKKLEIADQEKVWRVITVTMPSDSVYEKMKKAVLSLHEVFPYIKDVIPTEDQYKKFLKIDFTPDFATFLAKVPPSDPLAWDLASLHREYCIDHKEYGAKSEPFAKLVFRLAPRSETLARTVFSIEERRLLPSEEALPFLYYCYYMSMAADLENVHAAMIDRASFFMTLIMFHTMENHEIRNLSINIVAWLFDLPLLRRVAGPELSTYEVASICLDLYKAVAEIAPPEFIKAVLTIIYSKGSYPVCHGYLLRMIFENRKDMITKDKVQVLLSIFNKYSSWNRLVKQDVENGVVALAKHSMRRFIPVLMASNKSFRRVILDLILYSAEVRQLFVDEYELFLSHISVKMDSLAAFECMQRIVTTEPSNQLDTNTYACLLSQIFMRIGLVRAVVDKMNLVQLNNEDNAIRDTLDLILSKSLVPKRGDFNIERGSIHDINEAAKSVASVVEFLSLSTLSVIIDKFVITLGSPNQSFIVSAGIFFLHLIESLNKYTCEGSAEMTNKAVAGLLQALAKSTSQSKLEICGATGVLPDAQLESLGRCDQGVLYHALVEGIAYGHSSRCKANAMVLLSSIIEKVPRDVIDGDEFYAALKSAYGELKPMDACLKPLEVYLDIKCDLHQFDGDDMKLSIYGLLRYLRFDESLVLGLITKLAGSDDVAAALYPSYGYHGLAKFGYYLYTLASRPYTASVVNMLCQVATALKDTNDVAPLKFKKKVLRTLVAAAKFDGYGGQAAAIATIYDIVQ